MPWKAEVTSRFCSSQGLVQSFATRAKVASCTEKCSVSRSKKKVTAIFITEHSFQGITPSLKGKSVTYVSGRSHIRKPAPWKYRVSFDLFCERPEVRQIAASSSETKLHKFHKHCACNALHHVQADSKVAVIVHLARWGTLVAWHDRAAICRDQLIYWTSVASRPSVIDFQPRVAIKRVYSLILMCCF